MSNLKEDVAVLKEQVKDIKENHLVHLQIGIDRVETKTWYILSSVILGFLVSIALTLWK